MKGKFVVLEGGDGCGKSTLVSRLKEEASRRKKDILFTREPGGTELGEGIRHLLLDPKFHPSDEAEALLYAAARAQHVKEVIRPALEAGRTVFCERYILSSLAYQGYGRGLSVEEVGAINAFAVGGLLPDQVIFVDLPPKEAMKRVLGREGATDRLEKAGDAFHQRVYEGYLALLGDAAVIDGTLSPEKLFEALVRCLEESEVF